MAGKSQRARRRAVPETKSAKKNLLNSLGLSAVNYKDTPTLRVFISERGKIRSRQVATAIKNAREMALLPYPPTALR